MKILGIESSCDDTCAAIVEDGTTVLSNVVASQIDIFAKYGGVIPEIAARSHLEAIMPVIEQSFTDAHANWDDIDAIAVTNTPGLFGSLLVGTLSARTLAILHDKPLYTVHHLKSHIYANWLETDSQPEFPLLALVISGGHTQIIYMPSHNHFEIIGTTLDDAIGECFDKVAKILGLPYPGGPSISNCAKSATAPQKYQFPTPKLKNPLDFSFSGLKTAVLRSVQKTCGVTLDYPSHELKNLLSEEEKANYAASFESCAVEILLKNLQKAYDLHPEVKSIVFGGGVSANSLLREKTLQKFKSVNVHFPPQKFSPDNAAMVASAAFFEINSDVAPADPYFVSLKPRSEIK